MRILIDLQSCQSGSRFGGIGRYSMNLALAMIRNAGIHELHFLLSSLMPEGVDEVYSVLNRLVSKDRIHVFDVPGPVKESDKNNIFRSRSAELIRENFIFNLAPDIIHITSLIEGFGDDVTTSVGRFLSGGSTVVTLYDLIPLVDKERYLTSDAVSDHYFRKLDDMKNAGHLLAISEYTRQEAVDELGIPSHLITNISSAVDEKFRQKKISSDRVAELKKKYKIKSEFLMYTGSFDQRKNHEALIKAFSHLSASERSSLQLLIVGNGWDGIYSHLRWVGREAGLASDDIILAGKIPDEDLLDLYNLCFLFVFPSMREGFGLPVLEAMSCGTPVIGSDSTSIPEVIGNKDALFDPNSIESIANKIRQVITDESFRKQLGEHSLNYAKNFSWDISAKKALLAFEQLHKTRVHANNDRIYPLHTHELVKKIALLSEVDYATDEDLISLAISIEKNQSEICNHDQKVGFITTWNTRCGIATYSEHLIENFSEPVTIFAPHSNQLIKRDEKNVRRCWSTGESDDLIHLASQIDKEEIKVLIIQFNYGFFNFDFFSDFLNSQVDAGKIVLITLHSTIDPTHILPQKKLSLLTSSLSRCHKVLVHTQNDISRLRKIGVNNVELFPHGVSDYKSSEYIKKQTAPFVIASYGYFLPNKGLLELIEAIALLRQGGVDIRLKMINAQYDVPESEKLISEAKRKIVELELDDFVWLNTDFLADEESLSLLEKADLIVFPYQQTGESSSAAVRNGLVTRRPVAVTPLTIFDDVLPAVFVLPGQTPNAISQGIRNIIQEIINDSETLKIKMNEAALWLEKHRYSRVGLMLENIVQVSRTNG